MPEHMQRGVAWREDGKGGSLVLRVGYCPDELRYFLGMATQVLKEVPEAEVERAVCGKVTHSSYCQGFTLMVIPIDGPKREIPGYEDIGKIDFNF